jgi:hypothetical protein
MMATIYLAQEDNDNLSGEEGDYYIEGLVGNCEYMR